MKTGKSNSLSCLFTLLLLLAICPPGSGQVRDEVVVVGAMVYDFEGIEAGAAGDLAKARRKFQQALQFMPYFPRSLLNLGICDDAQKGLIRRRLAIILFQSLNESSSINAKKALRLAGQAIKENPNYPLSYLCRAQINRRLKRFEQAQADYDKGVELAPRFALGYHVRGAFHASREEHHAAISDFSRAITLEPSQASAFLERGIAFFLTDRYDEAVQDFETALSAWPRWKENFKVFAAYLNRGIEKIGRNENEAALLDLSRAIELNPKFGEAYLNRGLAHLNLESFREAIADFTAALEREPQSVEALYQRGFALQRRGKYDPAVKDYLQAVSLDSGHAQAYYRLGEIYSRQKQFDEAIAAFDRVIVLDPGTYWAYYWKGLACDKSKAYQKAILSYHAFLEKAPPRHENHKAWAERRIKRLTKWTTE